MLLISGFMAAPAGAEELEAPLLEQILGGTLAAADRHEMAALALTLGVLAFAVVTAIMLLRTRVRAAHAEATARQEILLLRTQADRTATLLLSEPQVIIVWGGGTAEPEILGDTSIVPSAPIPRRILAFGTWLPPHQAVAIESAVEALRARGEAFSIALTTLAGRHLEAEGRAVAGRAVLRLKDITGTKRAFAELTAEHEKLQREIDALRTLIEALPSPIWARDQDGRLVWVNRAYATAVEASDPADAIGRGLELLDRPVREELGRVRAQHRAFTARVPVIVAGKRHVLDVFDLPTAAGSAGIGIDATEAEAMRADLSYMVEAHRRTVDQLPTAVAIFTGDQRLAFANAACRALWALDPDFLEQAPTDSAVLDRLRAARKLPEEPDFRQWKNQLLAAYRAIEPTEHWWHLPDGRTLRVVTTPNPEGGVTYLFDDVTERLQLERRYDALIRVQGETLDNLAEAVALFASDGRLRLHNPAFARMWRLAPALLADRPHIETVMQWCQPLCGGDELWQALRAAVTGMERRDPVAGRLERNDGSVLDCATLPLPDGATLLTFQDVTDTVNVERALRERNEALEAADEIKNDFVHHVSYELRTPLTNIIGFAHLLYDITTGPLTEKQREYLGYISSSGGALLAIINDVLDLASIDAGAMMLEVEPVDIRATMLAAAEGVKDRLTEHDLTLQMQVPNELGSFMADERRIRQVLYNLLSNAIAFSSPGAMITLSAERSADAVKLAVIDRGRGIPREIVERVFHRFETHPLGAQHRGTGLGLSIVRSFVELHGGTVTLESAEGQGTTVICTFPLERTARRGAAA